MGILDKLSDPAVWRRFREYKTEHGHISDRDLARLDSYIAEEKYLSPPLKPLMYKGKILFPLMGIFATIKGNNFSH